MITVQFHTFMRPQRGMEGTPLPFFPPDHKCHHKVDRLFGSALSLFSSKFHLFFPAFLSPFNCNFSYYTYFILLRFSESQSLRNPRNWLEYRSFHSEHMILPTGSRTNHGEFFEPLKKLPYMVIIAGYGGAFNNYLSKVSRSWILLTYCAHQLYNS